MLSDLGSVFRFLVWEGTAHQVLRPFPGAKKKRLSVCGAQEALLGGRLLRRHSDLCFQLAPTSHPASPSFAVELTIPFLAEATLEGPGVHPSVPSRCGLL